MNTAQNLLPVANTIADQIGHRAFLMMGTRYKVGDEKSLSFYIRGCPAFNKCRVTLEPNDTYTVEFFKIRGVDIKAHKAVDTVYADSLCAVIEITTGLHLSL